MSNSFNSFNQLTRVATSSDLSLKNMSSSKGLTTPTPRKPPLGNSETVIWLKKRYQHKAKSKYFLPLKERDINMSLNQVFGLFCDQNQKTITLSTFFQIFELCRVPIQLKDVANIFFTSEEREFISLKEFKRKFLSERSEAKFSTLIKSLRQSQEITPEYFLPSSLREVLDFLNYKMKRNKILKKLDTETDVRGKISNMKDLFSMKVERRKQNVKEIKDPFAKTNQQPKARKRSLESPFFLPFKSGFFPHEEDEDDCEFETLRESIAQEKSKIIENLSKKQTFTKKISLPALESLTKTLGPENIVKPEKFHEQKPVKQKVPTAARTIMDFNMHSARQSYECKLAKRILNFHKQM